MLVYRIARSAVRAQYLSGIGAFKYGGRWNNKGTYILYTSMNSSLAYLENLVHFDESMSPPDLYITAIEINDDSLIYELPDNEYPQLWQVQENAENKMMGDKWMIETQFIAIKVRSAINPTEFNFLINPLYPGYHDLVVINSIQHLKMNVRLIR